MAEEDNFDIDIYGDDVAPDYGDSNLNETVAEEPQDAHNEVETRSTTMEGDNSYNAQTTTAQPSATENSTHDAKDSSTDQNGGTQAIGSTAGDTSQSGPPKQAPVQQGVKRKEGMTDDREIAPNATTSVLIGDLHWYQDEDDVRGWANQAGVEDEVVEVTFNEHKVNGKSKG